MTVLAPAARAFAERTAAGPHPFELGLEEGRREFARQQAIAVRHAAVESRSITVPGGPLGGVPLRIVRPRGARGSLPVILYVHGGWAFGGIEVFERLVGDLVAGTGAALVFPSYGRSLEARCPVAIEACYAVAAWAAERGAEHGLDGTRLALVGDSIGGNIAAVLALLAKERGGPPIRQQVLICPATDAAFDTASYREFATGHWLRRDSMRWFWDQYANGENERGQVTASPLRASLEQLAGLPPALVITAEADVLRDEGEAYAVRLRQAGVPVTAVRYQGTIHDFVILNPLADSDETRAAIDQASSVLRSALKKRSQQ